MRTLLLLGLLAASASAQLFDLTVRPDGSSSTLSVAFDLILPGTLQDNCDALDAPVHHLLPVRP